MHPITPMMYQEEKVTIASETTMGTKTAETRSAKPWIGALLSCADSTKRTIWLSAVSEPTREARITKTLPKLTVEPMTWQPGCGGESG